MTVLQRPARTAGNPPSSGSPRAVAARARALVLAGLAGALAVVISVMVLTLPVVVAWVADERSTTSLWQALGLGLDVWALAHRGAVLVDGARVVLAPLLLTLVPLLACRYAVNQVVVDRPEIRGEVAAVRAWRAAWQALGGAELSWFTGGYVLAGAGVTMLSRLGPAQVPLGGVLPGLLAVPLLAIAVALRREHRRRQQPTVGRALRWISSRVPVLVLRGLRPAAEALAGLLVAALLLLATLLTVHADRVQELHRVLDVGAAGATVLTVAQLAALPNAVVWVLGWMSGAPLVVGPVRVAWTQASPGDLPLLPALAALPEPGPLPGYLSAVVLVPVLAGVWVGVRSAGAAPRLSSWWAKVQIAVSACLLAAAVVLALCWTASGGMTPGLLAQLGPSAWRTAGLLLAELLAGALLSLTVLHVVRARRL